MSDDRDLIAAIGNESQRYATRDQLAAAPTGTEFRTTLGDRWIIDHGPGDDWHGGRTHIYLMRPDRTPDWDRVFYPANFDLLLPVEAVCRRRWTVCKSGAGEWLSFDLYGVSARQAKLTFHGSQPAALAATWQKIRTEERPSDE